MRAARPTRVLIACDHIDYDGALHGGGRQLIELARELSLRTDVVATICVLRGESSVGGELRAAGLPIRFFNDHPLNPVSFFRLLRIMRKEQIDVVHLTDYGASTLGRLAALVMHKAVVVQVIARHSAGERRRFCFPVRLAYRLLAPATARVLAVSNSVREFATKQMGFRADKVEVLYPPLPRHSFEAPQAEKVEELRGRCGIDAATPVVGAVTRFIPAKGITYLVKAFVRVRAVYPTAVLVLLGAGPEEERLMAQVRAAGVAGSVTFAGYQRDVALYESMFTVAAVPSLEEGFGLTAVEAMALGVPVVASDVGGLREVVRHRKTGMLVPPANPEALADAILELLDDSQLRLSLVTAAQLDVRDRFSLDRYAARITGIYHNVARKSVAAMAVPIPEHTVHLTPEHKIVAVRQRKR